MRVIDTSDAFRIVTFSLSPSLPPFSLSSSLPACHVTLETLAPVDETVTISVQKSSQLNDILCMNVLDLQSLERLFQIPYRDLPITIVIKRREPLF